MTSNDANGVAPANRPSVRHDQGTGGPHHPAEIAAQTDLHRIDTPAEWKRIERGWWVALSVAMLVFSAFPVANYFMGLSTKDYGLWYQVGLAVRQGLEIYPRPESGRLFPFMYPPSAAAMLTWVSMLGPIGSLAALLLVNSVAWVVSIRLSLWLAVGPGVRRHPLVVILPSLSIIVLVYNIYLLGQPNLLLLALFLGSFACLRLGRHIGAGALLATAAAIKAFPILAIGYLIYRRMWTATAATVAVLAAWLLIAPLPFRTPAQAVDDLVVWSQGMVFTYNSHGIAQRPFRSYSFKNQSIMALAHRLLRDVPADGESVLSRRVRAGSLGPRPSKGLLTVDPSTDLPSFLKSTVRPGARAARPGGASDEASLDAASAKPTEAAPRWDDVLQESESALRNAWRVNVTHLNFRVVTVITVAAMLVLCIFVAAVMPSRNRQTPQTAAIEFALVTLLTVMFSPLSFNYAYVWLIYPITLGLQLVISEAPTAPWHKLKIAWIATVILIPALAIPMPLVAQAYGNLFVPALLLVIGLGLILATADCHRSFASVVVPGAHTGIAFFSALANNAASSGEASSAKV
jgi:alpha-1,2-mannosyltransferase